ncbi:MAG: hypothetical protein C0524_06105 [Rhodobacter sp.]|nr:hypothetical protein [Rhodobacter sp.]
MLAARLSVEELLYRAETARPGSVVDLMLAPGEALSLHAPGAARASKRGAVHVAEDEMAIACVPPVGRGLRVLLREPGHGALWPLDLALPRDVAVALTKPDTGRLSLRRTPNLELVITRGSDDE